MDDLISRTAAIEALSTPCDKRYRHGVWETCLDNIETAIRNIPAVDAVPVIRCRDCKYSDTFADTTTATTPLKCLNIRYGGVYPDWYCEHGERRESESQ